MTEQSEKMSGLSSQALVVEQPGRFGMNASAALAGFAAGIRCVVAAAAEVENWRAEVVKGILYQVAVMTHC